jgi:hypothetical protein
MSNVNRLLNGGALQHSGKGRLQWSLPPCIFWTGQKPRSARHFSNSPLCCDVSTCSVLFHQLGQTLQVDDAVCCAMKLKMTACRGLWKTNLCGYAFYGLFSFLRRKWKQLPLVLNFPKAFVKWLGNGRNGRNLAPSQPLLPAHAGRWQAAPPPGAPPAASEGCAAVPLCRAGHFSL